MSYADIASSNIPPTQPQPDPALLTTPADVRGTNSIVDDTSKVNVVPHDFKSNPATVTSETKPPPDEERESKKKANKSLREAEAEGLYLWNMAKHYLLRPGVAGGLIGLANISLLASATHSFYTQPHLRRDRQVVASTIAGALAILGLEGYAAEKYRKTPRGQEEERRAKQEGAILYRYAKEHLLRPGVLGGLVGIVNAAVLGAVGYFSYINWDKPTWDRRVVSAVSVGLLTLWGGEGALAEKYRTSRR
ncbi:hypothetical protein Moror_11388 [Moniliophthora roreri MCA 2997]|uniref:Uncharacterized protein n=2 Tax=Moniliophthora roreri TaxID=221103 RepID=V2WXJ8_MONRO|nr:hypothetical protein Moror_11388 [Moniliophthora roreri MCA 2997]KAI3597018.1 hypothetical protein WG66_006344 [Moniliophthora roreri]